MRFGRLNDSMLQHPDDGACLSAESNNQAHCNAVFASVPVHSEQTLGQSKLVLKCMSQD